MVHSGLPQSLIVSRKFYEGLGSISSWDRFLALQSLQMIGKCPFMVPYTKFSLNIRQCQEQWVSSIFFMDLYCNFVLPTICLDPISVKICMFNGWARFETVWMLRNKSEKILYFFFSKEVPKIFQNIVRFVRPSSFFQKKA